MSDSDISLKIFSLPFLWGIKPKNTKEDEGIPDADIAEIKALTLTIDDNTDVEKYLKENNLNGFKKEMNIKVIEAMSIDDWNRIDTSNEIKNFVESIYAKID